MKNKIKVSRDLTAPICNSCGFELDFIQAHLECIACGQIYEIKKRTGLDSYHWR